MSDLIWHYTSLETLGLILGSNSLRATEVSFLNDVNETATGDRAFKAALKALKRDHPQFAADAKSLLRRIIDHGDGSAGDRMIRDARFIVCASRNSDSLYAWRTYASASSVGCAIALDPAVPLGPICTEPPAARIRAHHWQPVIYDSTELVELAMSKLNAVRKTHPIRPQPSDPFSDSDYIDSVVERVWALDEVRAELRALAKDGSFEDEKESRFTLYDVPREAVHVSGAGPLGPRPHVQLAVTTSVGRYITDAKAAPKLPIKAVRLGPGAPPIAMKSAAWALVTNGYEVAETGTSDESSVRLLRSSHPYRQA